MSKLMVGFIWVLLAFQAQSQTVIKRCADSSTVGGNSSCPSSSSGSSRVPVYKNYDMYGAIAANVVDGKGIGGSARWEGYAAAKKGALEQCEKAENPENCKVILTFKNTCGTVAATVDNEDKTIWASGTGKNKVEAMDNAAIACNEKAAKAGVVKKYAFGIWMDPVCAIDDRF